MSRLFTRSVRNWTHPRRAPLNRTSTDRRRIRLRVQDLEERATPANFTVTNTLDDGSVGSFRWAITQANAAGNDSIDFDTAGVFSTPQTIDLLSALPQINNGDLTINGTGATKLTIERSSSAGTNFGIFTIGSSTSNATFSGLTVKGGNAGYGGGFDIAGNVNLTIANSVVTGNSGILGGAINVPGGATGFLKILNSTISGNTGATGGIYFYAGGSLLVQNSTISGNVGTSNSIFDGGAMVFYGTIGAQGFTIENSTLDGNTTANSTSGGGAINFINVNGTATIRNSTVTGNTAPTSAPYGGGGIGVYYNSLTLNIESSIIALNTGPSGRQDLGVSGGSTSANAVHSFIGVLPTSNFTDDGLTLTGNPQLGPLQDNGGPTFTRAPLAGSPVIDAGSNSAGLGSDQRGFGFLRVYNGTADIGAVEDQPPGLPFAISSPAPVDGSDAGQVSYSFTVTYADPTGTNNGIQVNGANGVIGNNAAIRITGPNGFDQLATYVSIDDSTDGMPRVATYSITPPGGAWDNFDDGIYTVSIEANQVFDFDGNSIPAGTIGTLYVDIPPILVTNANDAGSGSLREAITLANTLPGDDVIGFDPAVFSSHQTISLASALPDFAASGGSLAINGPGIANLTIDAGGQFRVFHSLAPELTLSGFEVTGGLAVNGNGGGLLASGIVTIDHMLFDNNSATRASGSYFDYGGGGAIAMVLGNQFLKIESSTISGNTADVNGGGVMFRYGGTLEMEDSTVTGNSTNNTGNYAGYFGGGGLFLAGVPSAAPPSGFTPGANVIRNSTIANNTTPGSGGGIWGNGLTGNLLIQDSTISGNSASSGGTTNYGYTVGGGGMGWVFPGGSGPPVFTLTNSIVAGNTDTLFAPDIQSTGTVNVDFSAVGDAGGFTLTGSNNIPFGTDLKLGPLQDNGGPTQTMAPQAGSPLINVGSDDLIPSGVGTDQRGLGFYRSFGDAVDIGAVEDQPISDGPFVTAVTPNLTTSGGTTYTFTVTYYDPNGTNNGIDVSTLIGNDNAVRVLSSNGLDQLATFVSIDNPTNGAPRTVTYSITAPNGTWEGADTGHYVVQMQPNQVADLDGNFAPFVTLSHFVVAISPMLVTTAADSGFGSLRDLISIANSTSQDDVIGFDPTIFGTPQVIDLVSKLPQISATGGALTIDGPGAANLTVDGGGQFRVLDSRSPFLTLSGFTITGGVADDSIGLPNGEFGGGIRASGNVTLDHMVITGNSAIGHANYFDAGAGGGVAMLANSFLTVENSTISNNSADQKGGGIFMRFGGGLNIINSTISGNTSSPTGTYYGLYGGGGIFFLGYPSYVPPAGFQPGVVMIQNSTIANNTTTGSGGAFNGGEFSGASGAFE